MKLRSITAIVLLGLLIIYYTGCNNNSVTNSLLGGSSVSFSISQANGTQGVIFYGKANVDVKITKVIVSLATQNFFDTLTPQNPNYVYSKDTSYPISEFTGVQSGQKWNFAFTGATVSAGSAYTSNVSYTIP